jgi:hypothetical protein
MESPATAREICFLGRYVVVPLSQIEYNPALFYCKNPNTMNTENFHIGTLIEEKLKEKERSIAWLARKVGCNSCNLSRMLKTSFHIHSELLLRIAKVLDEDFFVHYSEMVRKNREV